MGEARSVMQFVHVVALLVDAQRALELNEGLTHREVTLASGAGACWPGVPCSFTAAMAGLRQRCSDVVLSAGRVSLTDKPHPHPPCCAPPCPPAADVVAEGRLLVIVANKLDALAPPQRQQALALIRSTVEDTLPDVR